MKEGHSRPCMGRSVEEILEGFRDMSRQWAGHRITEAEIVGTSLRFRLDNQGKLLVVVGDICVRDATRREFRELYEAIELGQAQIFQTPLWVTGRKMTRTVLHQATGAPIDPNSPAAREQQRRFALAETMRNG